MTNIFIVDNCVSLHADQFDYYYQNKNFFRNIEYAIQSTGTILKILDGEYNGCHMTTGDKDSLDYKKQPFSSATGLVRGVEIWNPETISGFNKCKNSAGKVNYDRLIIQTASQETASILSDDPKDMGKYNKILGFSIPIYSFWDLLIATIHHSNISLSQSLDSVGDLKKEGYSRFLTKFWEGNRKIFNGCIFCGSEITDYVTKFEG